MEMNGKNVKTIVKLIVFTVVLCFALANLPGILAIVGRLFGLLTPLLIGLCLAFVLNVPMGAWENRVLKKVKIQPKKKRALSILLTFFSVLLILYLVMWMVVPQMVNAGESIAKQVPAAVENFQEFVEEDMNGGGPIQEAIAQIGVDSSEFISKVTGYITESSSDIMSAMMNVVSGTFSVLMNLFLGIIFAIYVLAQKESLVRQSRQLIAAFLPERRAGKVLEIFTLTEETFRKFITGQCLEAVILGSIFAILMSIIRLPYAIPISVLIMITALIPVLGSFIGCFVGAVMILVVSPMQALIFVILFLVIQQVEGNLIYPHVVGGSVGLPSIWVFAAVIIGGKLFGVVGMLVFIPLCSVVYALLRQTVYRRLAQKKKQKTPQPPKPGDGTAPK